MGSLIIKQVEYSGDKYYFKSPKFSSGINVIKGDNGSGKSTFSYFIEFGLGGDIKIFNKNNVGEKYKEIIEDKNNYIELDVLINNENFKFKRFIGTNDIFIEFQNGEVKKRCLRRQDSRYIFSDWLLSKLEIERFKLSLGSTDWYFNFNDIFRLLYYDQDTELRKIYKKPNSENFVTDSAIIRKSIFETLMGTSSDEYFLKMNELNDSKIKKQEAKILLDEFNKLNPNLKLDAIKVGRETLEEQIHKLIETREEYQQKHTHIDKKLETLYTQKEEYEKKLDSKSEDYTAKSKKFKSLTFKYKNNQESIINSFNEIYNKLMKKSSAKTKKALIDDDYMPFIDDGMYREKSASIPIRMMYFFTLLSMSLKYRTIKHPKFLLMDTPEDSGIDDITENIELFDTALELSKNNKYENIKDYQFILTTGLEKCPKKFEKYVKLDFNKEENRFILKAKR
jgi:hypothetical protein